MIPATVAKREQMRAKHVNVSLSTTKKRNVDDANSPSTQSPPSPKARKITKTAPSIVSPDKTTSRSPPARNSKNQGLLDKLSELADAMLAASSQGGNEKNKFKGQAIQRAASVLSTVDFEIQSGKTVSEGSKKVSGVGKGTAYYIDEYLRSGQIKEIAKLSNASNSNGSESKFKNIYTTQKGDNLVIINRAPVLTLWVTLVAEREGFTREESLSYGKFVAARFAQSKGQSLGILEKKSPASNGAIEEEAEYVVAFGRQEIPVRRDDKGNRLAILNGLTVKPSSVDYYFKQKFGGKLAETEEAMKELVNSFELDQLKEQAYDLYTRIRPEWRGWGNDAALNLSMIRRMAKENQK